MGSGHYFSSSFVFHNVPSCTAASATNPSSSCLLRMRPWDRGVASRKSWGRVHFAREQKPYCKGAGTILERSRVQHVCISACERMLPLVSLKAQQLSVRCTHHPRCLDLIIGRGSPAFV